MPFYLQGNLWWSWHLWKQPSWVSLADMLTLPFCPLFLLSPKAVHKESSQFISYEITPLSALKTAYTMTRPHTTELWTKVFGHHSRQPNQSPCGYWAERINLDQGLNSLETYFLVPNSRPNRKGHICSSNHPREQPTSISGFSLSFPPLTSSVISTHRPPTGSLCVRLSHFPACLWVFA